MLAPRFDYLVIDAALLLFVISAYSRELKVLLRRRETWITFAIYLFWCVVIELWGIHTTWWRFAPGHVTGLYVAQIPLEEYLLMVLIFVFTLAAWEDTATCTGISS
jgi:lycopene cyclase domain-containing protein